MVKMVSFTLGVSCHNFLKLENDIEGLISHSKVQMTDTVYVLHSGQTNLYISFEIKENIFKIHEKNYGVLYFLAHDLQQSDRIEVDLISEAMPNRLTASSEMANFHRASAAAGLVPLSFHARRRQSMWNFPQKVCSP